MSKCLELISFYNLQAGVAASSRAIKYAKKLALNSDLVFKLVLTKC